MGLDFHAHRAAGEQSSVNSGQLHSATKNQGSEELLTPQESGRICRFVAGEGVPVALLYDAGHSEAERVALFRSCPLKAWLMFVPHEWPSW